MPMTNAVDTHSREQLLEEAKLLKRLANAAGGEASKLLEEYSGHYTMIAYREKDGQAELHEEMTDFFFVLDGSAKLVTHGSIAGARSLKPGEVRGDRIEGGSSVELHKGDVAHIACGTPHQLLVPPGESFTYFVVKVAERR